MTIIIIISTINTRPEIYGKGLSITSFPVLNWYYFIDADMMKSKVDHNDILK